MRADGVVTRDIARAALDLYEVDELGLDRLDRAVLDALCRRFGGGPVGVSTLAVAVGEERETVEEVAEPFLVRNGFLARTPRGRVATRAAWEHLGLTAAAAPRRDRPRRRPDTVRVLRFRVVATQPVTLHRRSARPLRRRPASAPLTPDEGQSWTSSCRFLPLVGIALLFWVLFVRPARRRQQQLGSLQGALAVGDEVMLTSGIFGTVRGLDDEASRWRWPTA